MSALRDRLVDFVHGPRAAPLRSSLRERFGRELFGNSMSDPPRTYAQLRAVNDWGGGGLALLADPARLFAAVEWAAIANPSLALAMTVHYGACLATARELGNDPEGLARTIGDLDSAAAAGGILITELGFGSSLTAVRTRADFVPQTRDFMLRTPDAAATKFAPLGWPGVAQTGIVYARLWVGSIDCGVFPFLLPLCSRDGALAGVSITPVVGPDSMPLDYATVSFDGVRVPFHAWLGDSASIDLDGQFRDPLGDPGRRWLRSLFFTANVSAMGAVAGGAATRASVSIALRYAGQRTTLKWPPQASMLGQRNVQRPLFGALATAYVMTCLVNRATAIHAVSMIRQAERGTARQAPAAMGMAPWAVHRDLSVTKAMAAAAAEDVARECRRRSGLQGVLPANRFAMYEGIGSVYNCAAGDNQLILLGAARSIVEDAEYPTAGEMPRPGELGDPRRCLHLLRLRESRLRDDLIAELTRGSDPTSAWNDHANLAIELAESYGRRLALETFQSAIEGVVDDGARRALGPLQALYAYAELERTAGWHLAAGTLTVAQIRTLPELLRAEYDRLSRDTPALVDALDVPLDLMRVPIATDDYLTAFLNPTRTSEK